MAGKTSSHTITCKAAVCWGPDEPLKVEEIQVEPPRSTELRVRMICASTCHTDILCWKGYPPGTVLYPRVLGHEGVGVVESVGEGVTDFKEGDVVIPTLLAECGECPNCVSNQTNLCLRYPAKLNGLMPDGSCRMSVRGQSLYHLVNCSTFTEYMVLDAGFAMKVPAELPPEHASLFSCGFTTGFGAVWKETKLQKGSTAAVFGLGVVGLGAVAAAKSLGAAKIIGVDVKGKRGEKAAKLGMTDFINPRELADGKTAPVAIKEMMGGLGVDYSIECTGAAQVVSQALEATVTGTGVTIVVGATAEPAVSVNSLELLFGKTLKGSVFGGIKPRTDLPVLFAKSIDQAFPLGELMTHETKLEDINRAFELLKQPECLKVLITFDGAIIG